MPTVLSVSRAAPAPAAATVSQQGAKSASSSSAVFTQCDSRLANNPDLLLLELVGAEDGEARLGLLRGEALPAAFEALEDLLDGDVLLPCIAKTESRTASKLANLSKPWNSDVGASV